MRGLRPSLVAALLSVAVWSAPLEAVDVVVRTISAGARVENIGPIVGAVPSVTAANLDTTTGQLVVVFVNVQHANTVTVTDDIGNTYTGLASNPSGSGNRLQVFWTVSVGTNASNDVTATLGGGADSVYFVVVAQAFTGTIGNGWTLEDDDKGSGAGNAPTLSSLTLVAAEGVAFVGMECDGQAVSAASSGFTLSTAYDPGEGNQGEYFADAYKIVSASTGFVGACGGNGYLTIGGMWSETPGGAASALPAIISPLRGGGRAR